MPNKTVFQLTAISGSELAIDDLFPVYDASETEAEKLKKLSYEELIAGLNSEFAADSHSHTESDITDLDKYTQAQVDTISGALNTKISGKADSSHAHDDLYYTEAEVNALTWTESDITDLDKYTQSEVDSAISTVSGALQTNIDGKANTSHSHDDVYFTETELTTGGALDGRYYTENEIGSLLADKSNTTHTHVDLYYSGAKKVEAVSTGIRLTGDLLPEMTGASGVVSTRSLGSPTAKFNALYVHDAYIDASSLYVNDKKVIEDNMDIITISTDPDQAIRVKTTGNGNVYIDAGDELDIDAAGGVEVDVPATNPTKHINFTNQSTNGNVTFTAAGTGGHIQLSANNDIDITSTNGSINFTGTVDLSGASIDHGGLDGLSDDDHPQYLQKTGGTVDGNLIVHGDFTVSGTTFYTQTETVQITDNTLVVNYGEVGAGVTAGEAGIEVERGSETNYKFVFDETQDNFRIGEDGSEQAVATREDSPVDGNVPVWDATNYMFSTASGIALSSLALSNHNHDSDYLGITAKAADSEKLDNLDSTSFARVDAVSIFQNNTVWNNNLGIYFKDTGAANRPVLGVNNSDEAYLGHTLFPMDIRSNGTLTHNSVALADVNDVAAEIATLSGILQSSIDSGSVSVSRYEYTTTSTTDTIGLPYVAYTNSVAVHVDGVYQYPSAYTVVSGGMAIQLDEQVPAGTEILVASMDTNAVPEIRINKHEETLSSTTDTITLPWTVASGTNISVYLDGVKQYPSTFTFTAPSTVTLDETAPAGTKVYIANQETDAVAETTYAVSAGHAVEAGFALDDNLLINGDFAFDKYASYVDNPTSAAEYNCVNRWRIRRANNADECRFGQSTINGPNSGQSLYMRRNSGDTDGNAFVIQQQIESHFVYPVVGKKLTLSFKLRADQEWIDDWDTTDVKLACGTGLNESIAIGGTATDEVVLLEETFSAPSTADTWTEYSFTTDIVVPADYRTMYLKFRFGITGTASADTVLRIAEIKLEPGETATPWKPRPYALEQILCDRYYENFDLNAGFVVTNYNGTSARGILNFGTQKRVNPTITSNGLTIYFSSWVAATTETLTNSTQKCVQVTVSHTSMVDEASYMIDGTLYIDAEL